MTDLNPETLNTDPVRQSVSGAVDQMVAAFQPQIEAYVNQFADQAIQGIETAATRTARSFEREPWILVGLAALMLASAGFMIRANRRAI